MKPKKHALPRRHVLLMIACCGMMAASLGVSNAEGVFFTPAAELLHAGRGPVTLYATFCSLATGICTPLVMKLLERVSVRRMACVGIVTAALSAALMGFADRLWLLYALGILRGAGTACFSLALVTTVLGNWFIRSRGTVTGVVLCFSGLTGAVCSPLFSYLLTTCGYAAARCLSAGLLLLLALPGAALILHLHPGDAGEAPYGQAQAMRPEAAKDSAKGETAGRNAPLLFVAVALFAALSNAVVSLTSHLSGFSESMGLGTALGATMMSAVMVGNVSSKLAVGVLCDRLGVFRALLLMLGTAVLSIAIFALQPSLPWLLLAASLLFGAIYSVITVGTSVLVRRLYGSAAYGVVYGRVTAISSVCSALSQSLIGFLYDFSGSYEAAFLTGLAAGGLCLVLLFALRRRMGAPRLA